ncbi:hypothetical protein L3Q82_017208 [Scortum barcoo]|uniref:Uncharacterized protein n=1 Tax=Scortum barcoo TaxID=214431 RepID=A0ACB8VLC0_9TELE|nr:hypothetical protein L3Q82_017208 [Scortum barcoo]
MSFLRIGVAVRSLRDRVRSSGHSTEELRGVEPLLLHIKRSQLRWLGHLFRMPPGHLPMVVFQACPTGRRPRGRPRTMSLSWPGNASESPRSVWGEGSLGISAQTAASASPVLGSWNPPATKDTFVNGLNKEIKDQLVPHELPMDFKDLVDLAVRIDNRLQERETVRRPSLQEVL